jgi:hypothetical protein
MTIVYTIAAWFVGIVAAAFLLAPPIIIVAFGIPFTYEMKRNGVLMSTAPVSRYAVSFCLLLSIFAGLTWAVWHFVPSYLLWCGIGVVLSLVPGLRKCGRNQANIEDFFKMNAKYVDREAFSRWTGAGKVSSDA